MHGVVTQDAPADLTFQVYDALAQHLAVPIQHIAPNEGLVVAAGRDLDPVQPKDQEVAHLQVHVHVPHNDAQVGSVCLLKLANHGHHLKPVRICPSLGD